ncbi:MAG: hypothetical protein ACLFVQ_13555 [Chitinispirillaceae bacterium]
MVIVWITLFTIALLGAVALMFYLVVELNDLDKTVNDLSEEVQKHYEN